MVFMDDGVGMPGLLNLSCPSTLGLTIVNALIGQLKGTMVFDTGGGCKISITFPVKTPLDAHRPSPSSDDCQIMAQTIP